MISEISIIVPVYKVEKYLCRCLDSIVAQTFTDWECVLIDDGSPDNSGAICDEYAAKDSRFRVVHQQNAGVSVARNTGLDLAKGKWVCFIDSDDWIEPETYETALKTASENDVDIVQWGSYTTVGNKDISQKVYNDDFSLEQIDSVNSFAQPFTMLISREFLKKNNISFPEDIYIGEDTLFIMNCYLKTSKIINIKNKAFYHYFQNKNSATHRLAYRDICSRVESIKRLEKLIDTTTYKNSMAHLVTELKIWTKFYFAYTFHFKDYRKTFPEVERLLLHQRSAYQWLYWCLYFHLDILAVLWLIFIHIFVSIKFFVLGKKSKNL